MIVVDASLFPFTGWRDLGIAPFAYLTAAWPPHPLPFDLATNALAYLPLGLVAGLSLHPRLRGAAMVAVAALVCAVLSIGLEAMQTYLPTRVASNVDVLANVGGGLVGALLAARFAHPLLDTSRLRVWRTRWFTNDASRGLVLVVLWFCALIYPDAFVIGTGGLLKVFDPARSAFIASTFGLVDAGDPAASALRFRFAEATVSALALSGAGLLLLHLMRAGLAWPTRIALAAVFVACTLTVATGSHAFLYDNAAVWPPLTPGARSGFTIGAIVLVVALALPRDARWALAIAALVGSVALVNVYPDNPYDNAVGLAWTRGKLMNFYGLASGLNLVWPYLAAVYLFRHRRAPQRRDQRTDGPVPGANVAGRSL